MRRIAGWAVVAATATASRTCRTVLRTDVHARSHRCRPTRLVLCLEESEQRTTAEQPFEGQGCPPPRPVFPPTAARCRGPGATVGEDQRPRRSTQWCNITWRAGWRSSARARLGRTRSLRSSSAISASTWTAGSWPEVSGGCDVRAVATSPSRVLLSGKGRLPVV